MHSDSNTATPKKRRQGQRLSSEQKRDAQEAFLTSFAQNANVRVACRAAGIDRSTVYRWQEHDETFSFQYKQAEADANDVIRAAIYQRAILGVDKPLHYQGRMVLERGADGTDHRVTVKDYSDTLLIFLAKARMPEFREKQQVELSGSLDVNSLAAQADARFRAFVTAAATAPILGKPDGGAEG